MSQENSQTYEITHDTGSRSFVCMVDGYRCNADYEEPDTETLDLVHTYVHPDLRGRGVAAELLKAFSRYAMDAGKKVLPTCSYAVVFYKRYKDFTHLVSDRHDPDNAGACRIKPC